MKCIKKNEIFFWVIPIGILLIISLISFIFSRDIGIAMLTTSIGIIFTTIWLNILLPRRENKQWEIVKNEVRKDLKTEVKALFEVTIGYFKGSSVGGVFPKDEDEEKVWERYKLEKLEEFSKKENLDVSSLGTWLLEKGTPSVYSRYKEEISTIESKYFKFLKPEEVLSLIKIQKILTYLIRIVDAAKIKNSFFPHTKEYNEQNLSKYSIDLYKEILNFHNNSISLFDTT
jgi:hypothetical protein